MSRVSPWKRWLSYLTEVHIESAPSEINPHLYVSLRKGRFQLSTAHAVYSYDDLYRNFGDLFERLDLKRLPGDEVLILGFGLGSVPYLLEKQEKLAFSYTGIELDEHVVQLASTFTLPRLSSPVHLITTDADIFLSITEEQYDLIIIDVFLDDFIPPAIRSLEFLGKVKRQLRPGGLVIMNTLAALSKDREESQRFFQEKFRTVFPEAVAETVPGNLMLLSSPAFFK